MSATVPRCPHCGDRLPDRAGICPGCDGDVAPLRRIEELADRYFNDGLDAAARRNWAVAREHLAVAVALNPSDTEAAVLLGKVRYRHGDPDLAVDAWNRVLRVEPENAGARAAIEYATTTRPSGTRRQGKKRRKAPR